MKEIIELGQEAATWITGDIEIGKTVQTVDDSIKAIKTALAAGREDNHSIAQAAHFLRALRLNKGGPIGDCWCQFAIGNPMFPDHTNLCKEIKFFMTNKNA